MSTKTTAVMARGAHRHLRSVARLLTITVALTASPMWGADSSGSVAAAAALGTSLRPRSVPEKPTHTKIGQGDSRETIQLKFVEGSSVELRGRRFVSDVVDVTPVNETLSIYGVKTIVPMIPASAARLRREKGRLEQRSGRSLADLSLYSYVKMPRGTPRRSVERLIDALNASPTVELAAPAPAPAPPPTSYDFSGYQGYRFAAPLGIGATSVSGVTGARGDYVSLVDIEYSWNVNHEDLSDAQASGAFIANGTPNDPFPNKYKNHGTAVLGELSGDDNGFGVTGIVPNSTLRLVNADNTQTSGLELASAIYTAAQNVGAGDVILIEQQTPGPNQCSVDDQCGLVAVEYEPSFYDAITWATAKGIIVVEPAGNGHQNLDGTEYDSTFNGRADSGAIIVGAGAARNDYCPQGYGSGLPARSRLDFSNYGSFVDVQGWGECVTTTGYGNASNTTTAYNAWYTYTFGGTSSASPIVASAAAAYSSAKEAATGVKPTSKQVRQALVLTGTPQDTTSTGALSGKIGPLPNMKPLLALATDITPPTVTAPVQTIASGRLGATAPTTVSWSASDANGIKSYELWVSTNGGAWVRDTKLSPTATSTTYALTVGKSYRFFVRAYDGAGNTSADSAAAYGPRFTPSVVDDRSTDITYYRATGFSTSTWKYVTWDQAYNTTLTKSTRAGEYAHLQFTGRDVAFVASRASNRGYAKVYIDGTLLSTSKLYSTTAAGARIIVSKHFSTAGTHTIDVQTIDQSGYPTAIDVDSFVVNK